MTEADRRRWDEKYAAHLPAQLAVPFPEAEHLVSSLTPGTALDVACGRGGCAVWLAVRGWSVCGVDISTVGLQQARELADGYGVTVEWVAADLDDYVPEPACFDLITVFRYLDRQQLPQRLISALRPDGYLIYETFVAAPPNELAGVSRCSDYVWQPGELLRAYEQLTVEHYAELRVGNERLARLIAQKPCSNKSVGLVPTLGNLPHDFA